MKKHEIIQFLVDKEAKEQGYDIEQRDAFMAGCDSIYDMIDGYKTIDGMMNWGQRLVPELKDDSKAYFVKMMLHRQADDYEVLIEELRLQSRHKPCILFRPRVLMFAEVTSQSGFSKHIFVTSKGFICFCLPELCSAS